MSVYVALTSILYSCAVLALCVGITRWVVVSVVLIGGADFGGVVKAPYKANELGGIGMMATH